MKFLEAALTLSCLELGNARVICHALQDLRENFTFGGAEVTNNELHNLIGDAAVTFLAALFSQHVHQCLAAHELAERGHHDGVAEVCADATCFFDHGWKSVAHTDFGQLALEGSHHAARNLVAVEAEVILVRSTRKQLLLLGEVPQ